MDYCVYRNTKSITYCTQYIFWSTSSVVQSMQSTPWNPARCIFAMCATTYCMTLPEALLANKKREPATIM